MKQWEKPLEWKVANKGVVLSLLDFFLHIFYTNSIGIILNTAESIFNCQKNGFGKRVLFSGRVSACDLQNVKLSPVVRCVFL